MNRVWSKQRFRTTSSLCRSTVQAHAHRYSSHIFIKNTPNQFAGLMRGNVHTGVQLRKAKERKFLQNK